MEFRADKVEGSIARLDTMAAALTPRVSVALRPAMERWRADVAALRFHLLRRTSDGPMVLVMLGGTGTGKSTIVNRVLGQNISATSFRRTFTSGPVAVAGNAAQVPAQWLGVEHVTVAQNELPARGKSGTLVVAELEIDLTRHLTLVDTPDLDGDQPLHHAEADRAFRWADAIVFLVTPEKYQMTELLPYYRLVSRYQVPALFVMNKCEQQPVADDYQKFLRTQPLPPPAEGESAKKGTVPFNTGPGGVEGSEKGSGVFDRPVFIVPRDDAGYEPPPEQNLQSLQQALMQLAPPDEAAIADGRRLRSEDLLGRLNDQILAPLREDRREIDRMIVALRAMEAPMPGVDVNPLTQQLQRRMQQRSVLYLMGPQRILDRLRQAPSLLVRLPRVAWDYVIRGDFSAAALNPNDGSDPRQTPDFHAILKDQFAVLQSRLDDTLRASPVLQRWMSEGKPPPYQAALMDSAQAGQIADEELAELKTWLEKRWNATPRDTRVLESLLKFLPGGKQVARWTEAAPYLLVLTVAAATHHLFGGVDLIVLGGWSLATWLSERLSNEVASHTRQTNQKITDRFARLAHEQIERVCRWLDEQAPHVKSLDQLEKLMEEARRLLVNE